uniref:Deoxynucleotidyltransferase terminal-interacting protein 1 n=1 Tax=Gopherus agassizii TaxID=38772 RepID=A0A452IJP5_9SAUR
EPKEVSLDRPRNGPQPDAGNGRLSDGPARGPPAGEHPWNVMIKHRQVQRRGRRSQMTTSFTDPAVSMDLLRAVLQPSINEEIQIVFNKYMKKAAGRALPVRAPGLWNLLSLA